MKSTIITIPKVEDWTTQMDRVGRKVGMTVPLDEIPSSTLPMLVEIGVGYLRDAQGIIYTVWKDRSRSTERFDAFRVSPSH